MAKSFTSGGFEGQLLATLRRAVAEFPERVPGYAALVKELAAYSTVWSTAFRHEPMLSALLEAPAATG